MTNQEIRNVAFRGPLNNALVEMSSTKFLRQQLKIPERRPEKSTSYKTMLDVEYVLRFLTLRGEWKNFGGSFSSSMDEYMRNNQGAGDDQVRVLRARFQRALDFCQKLWGAHAFQRWTGEKWREQLISGVFDAQMLAVDELPDDTVQRALADQGRVVTSTKAMFSDKEFEKAVRIGTNTPRSLRLRVERVTGVLNAVAAGRYTIGRSC